LINFSEAHKRRRGFFEASIILYCFAEYDQLKIGLKEKKTRFKEANKRHNSSEFCCFSALCEERMVQGRRSSRFKSFVFVFVFFFFFFFFLFFFIFFCFRIDYICVYIFIGIKYFDRDQKWSGYYIR